MPYVIDPGVADVMIGSSSRDIRAKAAFAIVGRDHRRPH